MTTEVELEPEQERSDEDDEVDPTAHLDDLEDGAGCTEIWSHLSESRDE
ncbi:MULTISPECIES: hypothetical protein [Haloferax]|nr:MULTISPECIES: hypothetical protein [Haloferax]